MLYVKFILGVGVSLMWGEVESYVLYFLELYGDVWVCVYGI